jgi:hypothetical protein
MSADWTGLIGIALAALLASVGYVYQLRLERKKSARGVLYLLLEIRASALAAVFDPAQAADAYVQHCISRCRLRGIKMERSQFPSAILDMVTAHFDRGSAVARSKLEDGLLRDYEAALLQLATIRPVLAYRLLGRDKLERLVGLTRSYAQDLTQLAGVELKEPWAKETVTTLVSEVQRQTFETITTTLDDDVLEVARSCGYLEYWRCRQVLRRTSAQMTESLIQISPLIDQTLERLVQVATQNSPVSRNSDHDKSAETRSEAIV